MKQLSDTHLFALYFSALQNPTVGTPLIVADPEMVHRIATVLRMRVGEKVLLFKEGSFAQIRLERLEKKQLQAEVIEVGYQSSLEPRLLLALPLLKREALEEAVYAATELGVQEIALIITEKSRKHLHLNELDRLQRIMVAACEQAKYFYVPQLESPVHLSTFIEHRPQSFFCDPLGEPFSTVLSNKEVREECTVLIGPEGDLTLQEKEMLKRNAQFIRLTPTVLRAPQAVTVALGCLRTLLTEKVN
jgi:RsmE family RNA methyltransferase